MRFVLPDITTENRLLARARLNDQNAIKEIYETFFSPIYQFVRLKVDETGLAEDITSEIFIKLIDNIGSRNGPQHSLRGWLFRVARNEVHRHYGNVRQFPTETLEEWLPVSSGDDLEVDFIRSTNIERARQALRMLVSEQQEVLILRFGEGLSLQETADIMGKSTSAIKSLQFRAVEALRRILGEMRIVEYG
jgi:RNA polymerase sigma-70 factor (ECF subfamily)